MFTDIKKSEFKIIRENHHHFVGILETGKDIFFKADSKEGFNIFFLSFPRMEMEEMCRREITTIHVDKVLVHYNRYNDADELVAAGYVIVPYPTFPPVQVENYNFRILDLKSEAEVAIPGIVEKATIRVTGEINTENTNMCAKVTAESNEKIEISAVGFSLFVETGIYVKNTETQVN